MTDQEKVLEMYPLSTCHRSSMGGVFIWWLQMRMRQYGTSISIQDYTHERAWARGWKYIQQEMIRKLEQ